MVWDDIQPCYKAALQEVDDWNRVAVEALKLNRENLAKEALKRKLTSKKTGWRSARTIAATSNNDRNAAP